MGEGGEGAHLPGPALGHVARQGARRNWPGTAWGNKRVRTAIGDLGAAELAQGQN